MTLTASTVNCRLCSVPRLLRARCSSYARDVEDADEDTTGDGHDADADADAVDDFTLEYRLCYDYGLRLCISRSDTSILPYISDMSNLKEYIMQEI